MNKTHTGSPKYPQIRQTILKWLEKDRFGPGSMLPPATDMAKSLKVNKLTVNRALNALAAEGRLVRRRGIGTFVVDGKKPPLVLGRSLKLGILSYRQVDADTVFDGFDGDLVRGILDEWDLDRHTFKHSSASDTETSRMVWRQPERGLAIEYLGKHPDTFQRHPPLQAVREGRYDGLITVGIIETEWLKELLEAGIPTVLGDFPSYHISNQADQIYMDPFFGYRDAIRSFFERGFRRIHFVVSLRKEPAPSPDMTPAEYVQYTAGRRRVDPDSRIRLNAYRQAMEELGQTVPEHWIHYHLFGRRSSVFFADKLSTLPESERPEILICHEVREAENLLQLCADRGLILEGAGASSRPHSGSMIPILADGHELGKAAAALLISRIQRPERPTFRVGVRMTVQQDGGSS